MGVKQVLLRQLRAVAMKEQRRDRNVSNVVCLLLATEFFQDIIVIRQPILHSSRLQTEDIFSSTRIAQDFVEVL